MIPRRCILLVLFVLLQISAWAGPVLVYKGTGKLVGKSAAILSGPVNIYVLVDPGTKQIATLTYYTRGNKKFLFDLSPQTYHQVVFPLDNGKTSVVYTYAVALEAGEFIDLMRAARGMSSGLKIITDGLIPYLHPKTLSGVEVIAGNTGGTPTSSELRYNVSYQQKRSIEANDASQTLQQTYDALVAELNGKGFN